MGFSNSEWLTPVLTAQGPWLTIMFLRPLAISIIKTHYIHDIECIGHVPYFELYGPNLTGLESVDLHCSHLLNIYGAKIISVFARSFSVNFSFVFE